MAVQAQHPSNLFRASNGVFEDAHPSANMLRGYGNYGIPPQILNGTVFSDPESELTCNLSGSRKRNRDDALQSMMSQQQQQQKQICEQQRKQLFERMESAKTSTSGRAPAVSTSLFSQDLVSFFHNQTVEVDTLIRLQNEKLRLGLEQVQKRHIRSLLLALEYRALKRLREKETELDSVMRRNAELEEKVKQMSAESQIWCHVARNNEAIVSNLRSSLEQILLQNSGAAAKEGYGDSSDAADDTQSCCYEAVEERTAAAERTLRENRDIRCRTKCKSCRENDVSVLLLPCRHLCLCKECESRIDCCPVCKTSKNASLQIFMS